MERVNHKSIQRCPKCNGYGVEWNENFERSVDRISDTQGLSFYDAIQQTKRNPRFSSDFWDCPECNGAGFL
jgi:uncharacterized protein with PIN domain